MQKDEQTFLLIKSDLLLQEELFDLLREKSIEFINANLLKSFSKLTYVFSNIEDDDLGLAIYYLPSKINTSEKISTEWVNPAIINEQYILMSVKTLKNFLSIWLKKLLLQKVFLYKMFIF